jgi:hypothetical protein
MTGLSASRRDFLLGGLAAACLRPAAASTVPEAATMLAPGPEGGPGARFAAMAARGLARGLVQAAAIRVTPLGGPDGVTAANRFAVSTQADGQVILVLPGQAAHLLLIGDPRARFEPRQWPALTASVTPVVVAGRGALAESAPARLALPGPASPDTGALLALDLVGRAATPVFLPGGMTPEVALSLGSADAVVLSGRGALARAAALGLTPWFAGDGPEGRRDPSVPEVPALGELLTDPAQPDLLAAGRAALGGLRVTALLALPALTSADVVAAWRAAARRWTDAEPELIAPATRRLQAQEAADMLATLCPGPAASQAYRQWLARRVGFQAG